MPNDNEVEVARNRYGVVIHHPDAALLDLRWLPTTAHMEDEDWKPAWNCSPARPKTKKGERHAGGLHRHSNWRE